MTQSTGKTLRVGVLAGIHNLDPQKAQDVDSLFVLRQIVEAPFATQPGTTELEPALFASGLESAGGEGLVYRAGLKDGLLLSDGSPLTARQVAECLQKVSLITEQAEVEHDGNDVVFRLRDPNPRFDVALSHPQCTIYDQSGGKLLGTGVSLQSGRFFHTSTGVPGLGVFTVGGVEFTARSGLRLVDEVEAFWLGQ